MRPQVQLDLTEKYGRLTIIKELDPIVNTTKTGRVVNHRIILVKCDCGVEKSVRLSSVLRGYTTSCGCYQAEVVANNMRKLGHSNRKHAPAITSAMTIFKVAYSDGNLTFAQFLELSQEPCLYCRKSRLNRFNRYISQKGKRNAQNPDARTNEIHDHAWFEYNGLDRLDSSRPHDWDNVVSCCLHCNRAKNTMTTEEFATWIGLIYENWAKTRLACQSV